MSLSNNPLSNIQVPLIKTSMNSSGSSKLVLMEQSEKQSFHFESLAVDLGSISKAFIPQQHCALSSWNQANVLAGFLMSWSPWRLPERKVEGLSSPFVFCKNGLCDLESQVTSTRTDMHAELLRSEINRDSEQLEKMNAPPLPSLSSAPRSSQ